MPNTLIHLLSNILVVGLVYSYNKYNGKDMDKSVYFIFLSNLIDLDHLLASPIYDKNRCSINFHPLHSWYTFPFYFAGLFLNKYRYLMIGIILHLSLDLIDCI